MKIGIIYNQKTNPNNRLYAAEISQILDRYGIRSIINPEMKESKALDLILAAGGDGTVLHAANIYARFNIPILGVNFGHRGYLCNTNREGLEDAIEKITGVKYEIIEKTRIQAKIEKRNSEQITLDALNEISIGGINRTVHLQINIKSPEISLDSEIIGDGLIISTRTGSTAYNINAGGPMLLTEGFSVVANNAFFQSECLLPVTKSIVTSSDVKISITDLSHNAANLPFAISDGQDAYRISKDDRIIISKSRYKNRFIAF